MTTLDAFARFLTARWDELEAEEGHAADCERNTYTAGPCDCGVPAYVLADLAAKRAIFKEAVDYSPELEHGDNGEWAVEMVVHHLAAPFRDHPDHPEGER